jgi:hypothetical protein
MMNFIKSLLLPVISVLALAVAVGCSNQKTDLLLEGDSECSPPCWISIMPGVTTISEADNIILNLEGKQSYSSGENDIFVDYAGKRIHVYSNNVNHIVEGIDFDLVDIPLEQLIDKFGEPEYLSTMLDQSCVFIIYYPDKGIHFMGQCKASLVENGWEISASSKVTRAFFTKPGLEMEELLVLFFGETSTEMMDAIIVWKGYGIYQ